MDGTSQVHRSCVEVACYLPGFGNQVNERGHPISNGIESIGSVERMSNVELNMLIILSLISAKFVNFMV